MGGFTAVFISKNNLSIAIILGLGLLVATILNLMAFEHPLWVAIASCVVVLLFAWLGGRYALYNYVLPNQHKQ
jgi:maltodextrin utilization protein YvdJ